MFFSRLGRGGFQRLALILLLVPDGLCHNVFDSFDIGKRDELGGTQRRSLLSPFPISDSEYDCDDLKPSGALFNLSLTAKLAISNVTFKNCRAGVISFTTPSSLISGQINVTLSDCTFIDNSATSATTGGAITSSKRIYLNLVNCVFTNNSAPYGGAVYSSAGNEGAGGLYISGSVFSENSGQGAAVYLSEGMLGGISSTSFTSNSGGSAVALMSMVTTAGSQESVVITGCQFSNNNANGGAEVTSAGNYGGGLYISTNYVTMTISDSSFTFNTASRQGGALVITNGQEIVTLSHVTFMKNSASLSGGAIMLGLASTISATSCDFTQNSAVQGGAALVDGMSYMALDTCTLTYNSADKFGGAMSVTLGAILNISDSTFEYNTATYAGAVECWNCGAVFAYRSNFSYNVALGSAGAMGLYLASVAGVIEGNLFKGNQAGPNASSFSAADCSRSTYGAGGALCVSLTLTLTLSDNMFDSNKATSGGAIFATRECGVEADSSTCISAQADLDSDNILSNNVAVGGGGGGVYALTVSALSISCSVNGNKTTYTGGDLTTSWPYHDEGCPTTWTGNSASDGGYGNGLATGFRQLKEADTGSDDRTNVNSNSVITVVLHMIDYLGTIMTRGSYETTGTTVAVYFVPGTNLSRYISRGYSTTTTDGLATFSTLQIRAPPGTYPLRFYALPLGETDTSLYEWANLTIVIRQCKLGEVTTTDGEECTECSGTSYYSFHATNTTCDECPSYASCEFNGTRGNTSTTDYGFLVPLDGYWHSSPFSPQMLECPYSDACTYDNRSYYLGMYQEKNLTLEDAKANPSDKSVLATHLSDYWDMQCSTGYTGRLCAQCKGPKYGWRSSGRCYECPSLAINSLYYCMSYLLTIVLLAFTIRATLGRSLVQSRALACNARSGRCREDDVMELASAENVGNKDGGGVTDYSTDTAKSGAYEGGNRNGRVGAAEGSRGKADAGGGGDGTKGILAQAAATAEAQLAAEVEGRKAQLPTYGSRLNGGSSSGDVVSSHDGQMGADSAAEGASATLQPAVLPGGRENGRSFRTPRSVRTRETRLAQSGGGGGEVGEGVGEALSEGSDGEQSPRRRHRLSRMSKAAAEGCVEEEEEEAGARNGRRSGGNSPIRGGPIAEGQSPNDEEGGGRGGAAWTDGLRRRKAPADVIVASPSGCEQQGSGPWADGQEKSSPGDGSLLNSGHLQAQLKDDELAREEKPPHAVVIKIIVNFLQVTSVSRDLNLDFPSSLTKLWTASSAASSSMSTLLSLDCSLPDNGISKAIQRTVLNVSIPFIVIAISLPIWMVAYSFNLRKSRKAAPEEGAMPVQPEAAEARSLAAMGEGGGGISSRPEGSTAVAQKGELRDTTGGTVVEIAGGDGAGAPPGFQSFMVTRIVVTMLTVIFYFYPAVTDILLNIFLCSQLDVDTGAYAGLLKSVGYFWELDYDLRCFRGPHLVLVAALGIPGLLLWCGGVPVASAMWLMYNAIRGRLNEPEFSDRYGFLYEDYRRTAYYWESIILSRKLLVVGLLLATNSGDEIMQVLAVMGVVVLAASMQAYFKPYAQDRFNNLELTSLVATLLILYLCCFFLLTDLSDEGKQAVSMLILLVYVGIMAWFVFCLAKEVVLYGIRTLDVDGDGRLTRAEVREWLSRTLGPRFSRVLAVIMAPKSERHLHGSGGDGGISAPSGEGSTKAAASPSLPLPVLGQTSPPTILAPPSPHGLLTAVPSPPPATQFKLPPTGDAPAYDECTAVLDMQLIQDSSPPMSSATPYLNRDAHNSTSTSTAAAAAPGGTQRTSNSFLAEPAPPGAPGRRGSNGATLGSVLPPPVGGVAPSTAQLQRTELQTMSGTAPTRTESDAVMEVPGSLPGSPLEGAQRDRAGEAAAGTAGVGMGMGGSQSGVGPRRISLSPPGASLRGNGGVIEGGGEGPRTGASLDSSAKPLSATGSGRGGGTRMPH